MRKLVTISTKTITNYYRTKKIFVQIYKKIASKVQFLLSRPYLFTLIILPPQTGGGLGRGGNRLRPQKLNNFS